MPRATLASVLLVSVALFCAAKALPQGETTSAIAGQVTDATSAAIPGALVTVTNRETGLQRRATADGQGRFNFPQLKPGAYSVRAEAEGFDPQQNNNVLSGLGQKQTVNFTLKVADSQQTVEVSGESPLINSENANTSTNLSALALENLPNPGGDFTWHHPRNERTCGHAGQALGRARPARRWTATARADRLAERPAPC